MYLDFIRNYLPGYLEEIPLDVRQRMWFQQDGPAHYYQRITRFLRRRYQDRLIIRNGPVSWPPRSPDLNLLDFYFWGYAKDVVYKIALTTRTDMMKIRRTCCAVTQETLVEVIQNFRKRMILCLDNEGRHFEHY